jgi:dipeptidyl aminopeptidase/acylaminoacyl peptidase
MSDVARPCGLWKSPIRADALAGQSGFSGLDWGADGALVWLESEDGHATLKVKKGDDGPRPLNEELSVEGGVGYGGGSFAVKNDTVVFSAEDGRLYRNSLEAPLSPTALTPEFGASASPAISPDSNWVAYVHTYEEDDVIGLTGIDGQRWPVNWVTGADFYMYPDWSPDGRRFAWMEWNHPNMPWDSSKLKMARLDKNDGRPRIESVELIAGGDGESIVQPQFSPEGDYLSFISDRDGWWHLYVRDLETGEIMKLSEGPFELGGPAWVQGLRFYQWDANGETLYGVHNDEARHSLHAYDVTSSNRTRLDQFDEYSAIRQLAVSSDNEIAFIGEASQIPSRVVTGDADSERTTVVERASTEMFDSDELSELRPVSWPATGGEIETVFGNYYPPAGKDVSELGEMPPAIVMIHGGPTSQRIAEFEEEHQFFTTRGFAVLDVNYRGSTGYGRVYRDALKGNWGIADVEDAVSGAEFLKDEGLADSTRIAIMGGSAGGYTVYQSLIEYPGVFAAGIAKYAVSNLFELTLDTHKFEERYTEGLVGRLPEAKEVYRERSPVFNADQIEDPLAIYQGGEDKVVPKPQADRIVEELEASGVPHIYRVYEDEGHGWSKSDNIEDFYRSALNFLEKHVVFA